MSRTRRFFFFFSSRRRHTRLQGDWSSDVCSSDLDRGFFDEGERENVRPREESRDERLLHSAEDRKSTRLNSSHLVISYAVFCLKKKELWRCPLESARYTRMD